MTHDIPSQQVEVERLTDRIARRIESHDRFDCKSGDTYTAAARAIAEDVVSALTPKPEGETVTDDGVDEYMTVTLSRDGTVTSHNAYEADFDEMVRATQTIVDALTKRLSDRRYCPYSHGSVLRDASPKPTTVTVPAGMKAWHGGDAAPDDWDGGPLLLRNGEWDNGQAGNDWRHTELTVEDSDSDIIAYTPKPTTVEASGMVERARLAGLEEAALIAQTFGVPGGHVADTAREVAKAIRRRASLPASPGTLERRGEMRSVARIVNVARAIGAQAGVGGRETAGAIVSYLATSADEIGPFMDGKLSPLDFKGDWMRGGCLSWHAANGKVVHPEDLASLSASSPSSEQGRG
jgi:hypothetical protein